VAISFYRRTLRLRVNKCKDLLATTGLEVDNACALQKFSEGEINFIFHHTESKTVTASDFMILVYP
jgi:hypothetical protein